MEKPIWLDTSQDTQSLTFILAKNEDLYWMISFFFILSKLIKLAIVLVDFFSVVPGMEPRALCMLHNGSITEIHPQLMVVFYKRHLCLLL